MRALINDYKIKEYKRARRETAGKVIKDILEFLPNIGDNERTVLNRMVKSPNDYVAVYLSNGPKDDELAILYFDATDAMSAFVDLLESGYINATDSYIHLEVPNII